MLKQLYFISGVIPCENKTLKHCKIHLNNFISFHDGTTPETNKTLGRSTVCGGSGLKFFKIILF